MDKILKKIKLLSSNHHYLLIVPQLGVKLQEPLPSSCWNFVRSDHVLAWWGQTVRSWEQNPCAEESISQPFPKLCGSYLLSNTSFAIFWCWGCIFNNYLFLELWLIFALAATHWERSDQGWEQPSSMYISTNTSKAVLHHIHLSKR